MRIVATVLGVSTKTVGVLLLASFLVGWASCAIASFSDDSCHHSGQSACECSVHCGCHAPNLIPEADTDGPADFRAQRIAVPSVQVKLPLFAASIFNPPRA